MQDILCIQPRNRFYIGRVVLHSRWACIFYKANGIICKNNLRLFKLLEVVAVLLRMRTTIYWGSNTLCNAQKAVN